MSCCFIPFGAETKRKLSFVPGADDVETVWESLKLKSNQANARTRRVEEVM